MNIFIAFHYPYMVLCLYRLIKAFIKEVTDLNRNMLYFMSKLTALICVTVMLLNSETNVNGIIISTLAFSCLFLGDLLLAVLKKNGKLNIILTAAGVVGCFFVGIPEYIPMLLFLCLQLIELLTDGNRYWELSAVTILLISILFRPDIDLIIISFAMLAVFTYSRITVLKLEYYKGLSNELRSEIAVNKKKLSDMNSYTKTLREITIMEERSRFAAKIHDELGHSISGSIILLEGARLNIGRNNEQAEKSIGSAAENLRRGVDNIRKYLNEERPDRIKFGIFEIKSKLEFFRTSYNIDTELITDGDLDKISIQIWICIQENLTETLTNILKHSDANKFTVKLTVHNKVIKAEFIDNGISEGNIIKGMGLEAIEERTAASLGRCLIKNGHTGFSITCIFML